MILKNFLLVLSLSLLANTNWQNLEEARSKAQAGLEKYGKNNTSTAACLGARLLLTNPEEAQFLFDWVAQTEKDDAEPFLVIARAHHYAGNTEATQTVLKAAIAKATKEKEDSDFVQIAWYCLEINDLETLNQAMNLAIKYDRSDLDNHMEWAAMLFQTGDIDGGLSKMEAVLQKHPNHERLLTKACQILAGTFSTWYDFLPADRPLQANKIPEYSEPQKSGALALLEGLVASKPKKTTAARLALALLQLGQADKAQIHLAAAEKTGKNEADTLGLVALAYHRLGEKENANANLEKAFEIINVQGSEADTLACGWLAIQLDQAWRVHHVDRRIQFLRPINRHQYLEVAYLYFEANQLENGLKLLNQGISKDANEEAMYESVLEVLDKSYRKTTLQ